MKKQSELLRLSSSSMKTYESCARKYYFQYIEKIKVDRKVPHLELGNFCHAVLEGFHNVAANLIEDEWPKKMAELCNEEKANYELSHENQLKAQGMLSNYLVMLKETGLPPVVANEQDFQIKFPEDNILIRGFIDRIDRDAAGNFHIVDYKGLALDTPIPTPNGWTTMGELTVGDQVLGSDGKPTNVLIKSQIHNRPCFKITFSDKTSVVCDNVHLWKVGFRIQKWGGNYDTILSAQELFDRFADLKEQKSGKFYVQNSKALQLPQADLPLNPWLLGAWLGDGTSKAGAFTIGAQDLVQTEALLVKHWGKLSVRKEKNRNIFTATCIKPHIDACNFGHLRDGDTACESYCRICQNDRNRSKRDSSFVRGEAFNIPLSGYLRRLGVFKNKHIPKKYLRGSFEQRLAFLQGLMDTDGSWNPLRNRAVLVSADKAMAADMVELIRTFGVSVQTFTATDKNGYVSYRIEFRPVGFNPFQLKRKADYVNAFLADPEHSPVMALRRQITNIESIESVPTQCISVDAVDHLYLCGEGMIPTHNTGKSKYLDDTQLLIYGLYLLETYPGFERFKGSYLMLSEKSKLLSYTFTTTDLDRALKKIKKIAQDIRDDQTWAPKPSFLCQYCDFENICPAMLEKRSGWSVKSDFAPKTN